MNPIPCGGCLNDPPMLDALPAKIDQTWGFIPAVEYRCVCGWARKVRDDKAVENAGQPTA